MIMLGVSPAEWENILRYQIISDYNHAKNNNYLQGHSHCFIRIFQILIKIYCFFGCPLL